MKALEKIFNDNFIDYDGKVSVYKENTLREFTRKLASSSPAPGGGAVSGLLLSQAYALISMVCNLTIGKAKFAEFEERLKEIQNRSEKMSNEALDLISLDKQYFLPLANAYVIKTTDEESKERKRKIMKKALITACIVPIKVIYLANEGMVVLEELMKKSSRLVVSDVGVAAECFISAIKAAKLNVLINANMLEDEYEKNELVNYVVETEKLSKEKFVSVIDYVESHI